MKPAAWSLPGPSADGDEGSAIELFVRNLNDPVIGLDRAWRYVYVNAAAGQLKGMDESRLVGRSIWEIYPEPVADLLHRTYLNALAQGPGTVVQQHAPAFECWFEVAVYPSRRVLWVWFRDVSERKHEEERLRREEERYRTLFERASVALYRTAADGRLLDVNDALVRMLGYPDRDSFLSVNATDIYVDARDRARWQQLLEAQDEVSFEMRDRRRDGSIIWVRDTAHAVRDAQGALLCYEGRLEDITAQREAAELLRESEERFRLLAQASDDVIWEWDVRSGVVSWNDALRAVLGYPPDAVGRMFEQAWTWWTARIHPDDRARTTSSLTHAFGSGAQAWSSEYRFRRLDGSYAGILGRMYIGRDEQGKPVRIIGALIDTSRHDVVTAELITVPGQPPFPATSDATLVDWIARGDEAALDQLYTRHATMLFATARSLLPGAQEAEEVVADVFVAAWGDAARYDVKRGSVTSWLTTMCRSRALDRTRKHKRRRLLEESAAARLAPEPVSPLVPSSELDQQMLHESLSLLPAAQRQVLELAYFGGLSHAQIAARLEEPLGTVKTRIRDGMGRLRRMLDS